MNGSYEGICVIFERNNDTTLFLIYFQIDCEYLTFIMTDPLNIILTSSVYAYQAIGIISS